jgi:hypothetical protein
MRQIGAGENQIARFELTDEVAYEISPACRDDVMYFVFWMKVPAYGVEGIAVLPGLERLATTDLDYFQIWIHLNLLPAPLNLAVLFGRLLPEAFFTSAIKT